MQRDANERVLCLTIIPDYELYFLSRWRWCQNCKVFVEHSLKIERSYITREKGVSQIWRFVVYENCIWIQ